jgi:hypothetical protein
MSRERDFIASNDSLFDNRQINPIRQLSEKSVLSEWDVPQQAYDDLLPLQAEWDTCYAVAKNPNDRTHAQVTAKNEARKMYENILCLENTRGEKGTWSEIIFRITGLP